MHKVVVVGQGYVGLPVSMRAVAKGHSVVGLDVDARRVGQLSEGRSYVDDVSDEELQAALASGRFIATTDGAMSAKFDVAVVTVPTPLRESLPDLTFIEESAISLAPHITKGATVILESTTYPGTTEELFVPLLESGSGLSAGTDFFVGYSPERIDPGNKKYGFVNTPKVVSGINAESLRRVDEFYGGLIEQTVPVRSPKEAELTKLLENTFRHVNIALINELAVFAHQLGIDVWDAVDAASSKPFGYMRFTPGPGVGGHCLPVDPSYLSWQVRRKLGANFRFVELANDVNDHMPSHVVSRVMESLNTRKKAVNGSKIGLVGLSYKKDTGDIRESPSLKIISLLNTYGAELVALDGRVEPYLWPEQVAKVNSEGELVDCDFILVLTPHSEIDLDRIAALGIPLLDTVRAVKGHEVDVL